MSQNVSILSELTIHPTWNSFLTDEIIEYLQEIENKIETEEYVTPLLNKRLRFLSVDLSAAKVVILGQDPYPQRGVATGRAFEVGGLKAWTIPFRNTSLRNIVRAVYAAGNSGEILNFNDIKRRLSESNGSGLLAPDKLFEHWEQQGVLLLNTSFTCRIGAPGSHAKLWLPFSKKLLAYINENRPELTWMLWGSHARMAVSHINIRNALISHHPMICHSRDNDFLFGKMNHFEATKELVNWTGEEI